MWVRLIHLEGELKHFQGNIKTLAEREIAYLKDKIKNFEGEVVKSWLTLPRLLQSTVASSSLPVSRLGQAAPESREAEPGGTMRSSMVADGSLFNTFQKEVETILKIKVLDSRMQP